MWIAKTNVPDPKKPAQVAGPFHLQDNGALKERRLHPNKHGLVPTVCGLELDAHEVTGSATEPDSNVCPECVQHAAG